MAEHPGLPPFREAGFVILTQFGQGSGQTNSLIGGKIAKGLRLSDNL